jgi:hypothetical protein
MKLKYHLYSSNANCFHCMHITRLQKMDVTPDEAGNPNYCGIISSEVEQDYYCDFYKLRKLEVEEIIKLKNKKL